MKPNKITIDDVEYVRADSAPSLAKDVDGLRYVLIRSRDAGCHAGYLKEDNETCVVLLNSRRLWYWSGACSLSQLAMDGSEGECKFAMTLPELKIVNHCEIIYASEKARRSIGV